MKNTYKTTTNSSAAGNLYQARMGPNSNTKTPEIQVFKLSWKEEEILQHGKYAPIPTILRPVAGIQFEMSSFQIVKFISLNICYVIYVLL